MTAAEDVTRGRKREGRRRAEQGPAPIHQAPFAQPRLTLEPIKYLSDDHIETIHEASLKLLEDVGMEVILNKEALEIYRRSGAKVEVERVRIGREVVEEALRRAPSEFVLNARNPAHSVRFGGNWITFGPVGGPPNCSDMDRGRRPGTFEDSCNFIRLSQFFNIIHMSGGGSTDCTRYPCLGAPSACRPRQGEALRQGATSSPRPAASASSTAWRLPASPAACRRINSTKRPSS